MALEPPLDSDLPLNSPSYSTLLKFTFLHRLLWHLFSTTIHHSHGCNIFSSICHRCQNHPTPGDCPEARVWPYGKGPDSPFPIVVSRRERPLHPFLTGKQVGTQNSLPPTYFQELKVSVFHIDCFDAVKCELQFL